MTSNRTSNNPLGEKPVGQLLRQFAIPSIVAMLVSSLYNIVDQFFIGQSIGELGNAATNIAFPLSTICTAIALLFGIGGSAAFNLAMGAGDKEKAGHIVGNSVMAQFSCGVILFVITQIFLEPMLLFFGAPMEVLPFAKEYTKITSYGFPFLIVSIGGGHLIRADGRPQISMLCNLTGAIVNTILDALFVFGFRWGMSGAALATIIGQFCAFLLVVYYIVHYQTVAIQKQHFIPKKQYLGRIVELGVAPGSNQLAMMVVQVVLNQSLKYYGARSIYGESIPIACVGIITKVSMIYVAFCIGISQGVQPIASFNYGAKQYDRVKQVYITGLKAALTVSMIGFLIFQIFPRQIIAIFGAGTPEYVQFAVKYFRIYLFFTFINCVQPMSSNFFTAIGKSKRGTFLSLTRQIIFLVPMILVLPLFMGIDGIMYAGPLADGMAALVSYLMIRKELKQEIYHNY